MEAPKVSAIRLGIVEFLGVFLPGTIWVLLLVTLADVLSWTAFTQDPRQPKWVWQSSIEPLSCLLPAALRCISASQS